MKTKGIITGVFLGISWFYGLGQQVNPVKEKIHNANQLYEQKNFKEAKNEFQQILKTNTINKLLKNELTYKLAVCVEEIEGVEASKPWYQKAAKIEPTDIYTAKALNTLGIFHRYDSNYDSAFYYYSKAAKHAEKYNYAAPYSNLRWHYVDKGDYVAAMKYALLALRIDERIKDSVGLAVSYTNLSEIEKFQKKYNVAIQHAKQSIAIQNNFKKDVSLSRNYENLGSLYSFLNDDKKAAYWYEQALLNDRKQGNKRGEAFSAMQMGALLYKNGKSQEGEKYFEIAKPLFDSHASVFDQNIFKTNYAFAQSQAKKWAEAIALYKEVIAYFEKEKANVNLLYTYSEIAKCYENLDEYQAANVFLKKYNELFETTQDVAAKEKLNTLTIQYETEKKERQILQQKNELIESEAKVSNYKLMLLISLIVLGCLFFIYRHFITLREKKLRDAFQATYLNVLQLQGHFKSEANAFEKVEITQDMDSIANLINVSLSTLTTEIDEKLKSSKSFNYTVSHELKRYLSQLETDISEIDAQSKNNTAISESLQKVAYLKNLTSKLLELSAIEKENLQLSDIDLEQLINQCLDEQKIPKNIGTTLELERKIIHADRLLLRQVFTNLLENATKYLKDVPNPKIKIVSQSNGVFSEVVIADNGSGIPDTKKQKQIFDAFYQADKPKGGSGLGLAIVKKIIERHNGYVLVRSNEPVGLCVGFGIPKK